MRQRSASYQEDDVEHRPSGPLASTPASGSLRAQARPMAPRLSLPQHSAVVPSTVVDEASPAARPAKRAPRPSSQALVVHTAETKPIEFAESASPSDLHLIPRTEPAAPSAKIKQSWFHKSSPRMTIIKLSLIGIVTVSVLAATFATAGGGAGVSGFFRALESVIPYAAPAQPVSPTTVAQRVKPIIQADDNAGYDSQAQHDLWWNSACSAAAMTEVLHAYGVQDVTIGQIIDVLYAHNPPYITPSGGLQTPDAWNYMMTSFHMKAVVYTNHSLSYDEIVRMTENEGIPVVLNVRDSQQLYYPALSVGHFLIAVGGDAAGLRIVDSSLYRITFLPYNELNYLWTGISIVITPK